MRQLLEGDKDGGSRTCGRTCGTPSVRDRLNLIHAHICPGSGPGQQSGRVALGGKSGPRTADRVNAT